MWRPKRLLQLLDSLTRRLSLSPPSHLLARLSSLSFRPVSLNLSESLPPQQGHAAALSAPLSCSFFLLGTGRWTLVATSPSSLPPSSPLTRSVADDDAHFFVNCHPQLLLSNSPHVGSGTPPSSESSSLSSSSSSSPPPNTTANSHRQAHVSIRPFHTHPPPSPTPSSRLPILGMYPARSTKPSHPPPVESPVLVPDFAQAWSEACEKVKVGISDHITSFDSL